MKKKKYGNEYLDKNSKFFDALEKTYKKKNAPLVKKFKKQKNGNYK